MNINRRNKRRPRKRMVAAAGLISIGSTTAVAQVNKTDAVTVSDQFMDSVYQGDITAAYQAVAEHWPVMDADELAYLVAATESHLEDRPESFGAMLGWEAVSVQRKGSLLEHRYLLRYENHGEMWTIQYYKNGIGSTWMVNTILSDDQAILPFK